MFVRRIGWLVGAMFCYVVACGGTAPTPSTPSDGPMGPGATGSDTEQGDPNEQSASTESTNGTQKHAAAEGAKQADLYADMPHPSESDSGRHQLAAEDVKETVKIYRPHLDKVCWTPRVNEEPSGPESVRVAIEVEVTENGQVKSIRVAGGKDYEGLTGCVEGHVKRWHFPKAKQRSSLMFPILFQRGESILIRTN